MIYNLNFLGTRLINWAEIKLRDFYYYIEYYPEFEKSLCNKKVSTKIFIIFAWII